MKKKFLFLITALFLSACQQAQTTATPPTSIAVTNSASTHVSYTYDSLDISDSWAKDATQINLDKDQAKVKGAGAESKDGTLTISKAGTYVLSGSYTGNVNIDVQAQDIVHLVLNKAELKSTTGRPLTIKQANKVVITLAKDTENTIVDTKSQNEKDDQATIFSEANLSFNGTGSLKVLGKTKNAIESTRQIVLVSGSYNISAKNDAIKAKEAVIIKDAKLSIKTKGDGIVAENEEDLSSGRILVENGTLDIETENDGLQSTSVTELIAGIYHITTTADISDDSSAKAIKSDGLVAIAGGEYDLNVTDDGVNSFDIDISGGKINIASGDDAIHADGRLAISNGEITIKRSLEGLEAADMLIAGGKFKITSSDDTINGSTDTVPENAKLSITGGEIQLFSGGDAIDINGYLEMTGGTVTAFGSPNAENMVIDYDINFTLTGGYLVGTGTVGILADATIGVMTTNYFQPTIATGIPLQAAGNPLVITDSLGNEIANITPPVNQGYLILSSPNMVAGETYTVSSNGQVVATVQAILSSYY